MKKIIAFLMLLIGCSSVLASEIKQMVFFGDSLTDSGNLYKYVLHILPKSPPYFQGRFTNGPTWAENVGKYYHDKYNIEYKVYAVGGATAVFHKPTNEFVTLATLELEVNHYLLKSLFSNKSKTLYGIWIGGNDYFFDQTSEPNQITTDVVNSIMWAIATLADRGGENFLILNMPDLSRTPFLKNEEYSKRLHTLSISHNQKLAAAIADLEKTHPNIKIYTVDIYNIFNNVIDNTEQFNKKYNAHITDTTQSCWGGGYILKDTLSEQTLTSEIQRDMLKTNGKLSNEVDAQEIARYIRSSPVLAMTYNMGKLYMSGILPCSDADAYLFWDQIHPTQAVHQVLSKVVIEKLASNVL